MSRFCMYCGRELEKAEKCNCIGSVNARQRRDAKNDGTANTSNPNTSQTSNTKKEKVKKEKKQWRKTGFERKNRAYNVRRNGNFLSNFFNIIKEFLKNPIYTVKTPGAMGKAESILIIGILGVVISLVVHFSTSSMSRNILGVVSSMIGIKGTQGFVEILNMFFRILVFTAFSYIQYFILVGIFYCIQRFILRAYADFWDLARRFAMSTIPILVVGVLGIIIGFFSMQTVIVLLLGAFVVSIILNYETLKVMWQGLFEDRLIYIMSFGYFVYFLVCTNLFMALLNA